MPANSGKLAFCAVFRDEAAFLNEWLRFHTEQGVAHFFLFDDRSEDNFLEVLGPWRSAGLVTLADAAGRSQEEVYTDCLPVARKSFEWLGFFDIDEFFFNPEGLLLDELLARFTSFAGVFVFWKLFGAGGLSRPTKEGVLKSFTNCLMSALDREQACEQLESWRKLRASGHLTGCPIQGKTVANLQMVREMAVHRPRVYEGVLVDALRAPIPPHSTVQKLYTQVRTPNLDVFRINHYWSRGLEPLASKLSKPGISSQQKQNPSKRPTLETALAWESHLNLATDRVALGLCESRLTGVFPS